MTAELTDFTDYKYTKIAEKFMEIREKSPSAASQYIRETVPAEKFSVVNKYILLELTRKGEFEPHEE